MHSNFYLNTAEYYLPIKDTNAHDSKELVLLDWLGRIIEKELLNNENHLTINLRANPDGDYLLCNDGQIQMD